MQKVAILLLLFLFISSLDTAAGGKKKKIGSLTFEGTLLAKIDRDRQPACGRVFVHQVAKYRISRIVKGHFNKTEIIVDHPSCDEDVFRGFTVGDRIKLSVDIYKNYDVITYASGIREQNEKPEIFYVASTKPERVAP